MAAGIFRYVNPPVICWGAGTLGELGAQLDRLGARRVALVTTHSVQADPVLAGAMASALTDRDVTATSLVRAHAPRQDVEAAVARVREAGADAVISFGGGSAIDAAKIVALTVGEATAARRALLHVAVPTTLSVAELAPAAGMTDDAGNKGGLRDERMVPAAVIYDANLALRTPLALWLSTGLRAVDHGVEAFLAPGSHPFADLLAVDGLARLLRTLPEAHRAPADAGVRTENQLGAWFAFTLPDMAAIGLSHMMGKQIGARYGIPHGVTSCLLLPHVLRYRARREPARTAELASRLGLGGDGAALADRVGALVDELELPRHVADYGVGEDELRRAAAALGGGEHTVDDLARIYLAAL